MKRFGALLLKYKVILLALLKPLGFWGMGAIAFVDSGTIPVPMDLIVAGYVWNDKRHFWLYALMAALGSALGGLIPFFLGLAPGSARPVLRQRRYRESFGSGFVLLALGLSLGGAPQLLRLRCGRRQ